MTSAQFLQEVFFPTINLFVFLHLAWKSVCFNASIKNLWNQPCSSQRHQGLCFTWEAGLFIAVKVMQVIAWWPLPFGKLLLSSFLQIIFASSTGLTWPWRKPDSRNRLKISHQSECIPAHSSVNASTCTQGVGFYSCLNRHWCQQQSLSYSESALRHFSATADQVRAPGTGAGGDGKNCVKQLEETLPS